MKILALFILLSLGVILLIIQMSNKSRSDNDLLSENQLFAKIGQKYQVESVNFGRRGFLTVELSKNDSLIKVDMSDYIGSNNFTFYQNTENGDTLLIDGRDMILINNDTVFYRIETH
ncbi:MAG: hypothetical protein KDC92_12870 [Bacteroidetes bacterium]|nr:hypothetical protein [Bacteroidota bacterium]